MTSGIYLLKFGMYGEPYTYVGKSVDISARLEQHKENMFKGCASKKLQWAYNTFGVPEVSILVECHKDHIGTLEEYFIDQTRGEYSLNTVDANCPFDSEVDVDFLIDKVGTKSLGELSKIIKSEYEIRGRLLNFLEMQSEEIKRLSDARSEEELQADLDNRYSDLKHDYNIALQEIIDMQKKIEEYKKLPWYKKIFTKPL